MARITGEAVRTGVILAGLALTAWLIVFGHRGVGASAGVIALAALADPRAWRGAARTLDMRALRANPLAQMALLYCVFCAWAALSALWSPDPGAVKNALNFFLPGAAGFLLAARFGRGEAWDDANIARAFVLAVGIAIAALIFEGLSGGQLRRILPPADASPFRYKDMTSLARGVSATVPLAFPAAALLWADQRRLMAAAVMAGALAMTPLYAVSANVIGVVAGLAAAAFAFAAPRAAPLALGAFAAALALASAPLALAYPADAVRAGAFAEAPVSWRQRVVIAHEGAARGLSQCPIFGCGVGYARTWSSSAEEMLLPGSATPLSVMPTHPHNAFVETQLEMGFVGAALLAGIFLSGALALSRRNAPRLAAATIAGVFASQLASAIVEMSLWRTWRFAAIALAAMGCALVWRKLAARGAP